MSTLTTKVLKEAMAVQDGLLNTIDKLTLENKRLQNKNNDLVKQLGSKVILDYEKGI